MNKTVVIQNGSGDSLSVGLTPEGGTFLGWVRIGGISYHVERVFAEKLRTRYPILGSWQVCHRA